MVVKNCKELLPLFSVFATTAWSLIYYTYTCYYKSQNLSQKLIPNSCKFAVYNNFLHVPVKITLKSTDIGQYLATVIQVKNLRWKFTLRIHVGDSRWEFTLRIHVENSRWRFTLKIHVEDLRWYTRWKFTLNSTQVSDSR